MSSNVIEINHLTKYYGKHRGIEDLCFSVEEGEIFGFIGPNGSGKSTAIRTLLALIFPTSGSATIFGKDCIRESTSIACSVGYLPSEVFYYDNMKAIDLLKYAASFYKQDCMPRIKELAEVLELDLNRKIEDLSYGNKKKVGIIQGLLHSPRLIILDEPTGGLDPLMQQRFFDLLKEENKKGVSIFFSSHILSEVQKLCDRVAILKQGKLIDLRKISELRQTSYKRISLHSLDTIPTSLFAIEGVVNFQRSENAVDFLYKGDLNVMVSKISTLSLSDMFIEEPSLEEIFLHYYR